MTTVAAILKHKGYSVTTVMPTASIRSVVETLVERRIGAVLVVDEASQLLGIVSERDIVRSLAADSGRTMEMTAGHLMTQDLQVTHPDTTVAEAMQIMTSGRFRHLPVVEHDTLIGLVSIGDVVKARIMQQDQPPGGCRDAHSIGVVPAREKTRSAARPISRKLGPPLLASIAAGQRDHRRLCGQAGAGHLQHRICTHIDRVFTAQKLEEAPEHVAGEIVHWQHDARLDLFDHCRRILLAHRPLAIHRDHDNIDSTKHVQILRLQQVMQVAEMGDA
jgi:CBS domain-containing protein